MLLKYLTLSATLFIFTSILGIIFTYLVIFFARRYNLYDKVEERKIHSGNVPRLGGIAILMALVIGILIGEVGVGKFIFYRPHNIKILIFWGFSLGIIFILGLVDDLYGLAPHYKILVEFSVAIFLYFIGFKIGTLSLPWGGSLYLGGWDFPLVLLWIVGLMNAINIVDGLDGLAAGISLFASLAMFVIFIFNGKFSYAAVMVGVSGALMGFLPFNIHPAKIFMGDSGSLTLGFILGTLALKSSQKANLTVALSIPIVIFFIPIMDTLLAIFRRITAGKPIFLPDSDHIHHRMLKNLRSHSKSSSLLIFLSGIFSLNGTLMAILNDYPRDLALVITLSLGALVLWRLGYFSFLRKKYKEQA